MSVQEREGGRIGSERVGESVQQNDVVPVHQYVAAGPSVSVPRLISIVTASGSTKEKKKKIRTKNYADNTISSDLRR